MKKLYLACLLLYELLGHLAIQSSLRLDILKFFGFTEEQRLNDCF